MHFILVLLHNFTFHEMNERCWVQENPDIANFKRDITYILKDTMRKSMVSTSSFQYKQLYKQKAKYIDWWAKNKNYSKINIIKIY